MRSPLVLDPDRAVALVRDGASVSISSSSGLGCPDRVLEALGERFARTGSPRELTALHPIAAGDMYGIKGVDHIAQPGMLRRIFAGSLPSGPSSFDPPRIRQLIESGEVEAYNIPSGVMFQMHRAAAARQPGVLTDIGRGTYADPELGGARMNASTPPFISVERIAGRDWLFYPALPVDVAIIRATTADPLGNLSYEHEASRLGALDQAYAAHNNGGLVIAQVERQVTERLKPSRVHVPGILIDVVVVVPDQMQTTHTRYDPALSGEEIRSLAEIEPLPWGPEKVIARRAARELHRDDIVSLGFGLSAGVPRVVLEAAHHDELTWVLEQGSVGGFPLTDFAFGSALNPHAIMQSVDQFTLLQGGGINVSLLSFLEVSATGDVNVSHLPARSHVTAGIGGFADITAHAPAIVFSGYFTAGRGRDLRVGDGRLEIVADGTVPKFVPEVAQVSFSGRAGHSRGQHVIYVTERAVLELRDEGLTVTEIAPGVDLLRDVLERATTPLHVAEDLRLMDADLFVQEEHKFDLRPARPRPALGAESAR